MNARKEYQAISILPQPKREYPSTYFVADCSNPKELNRLHIHDQLFFTTMGGTLPEQPDPTRFQRVLDVGCGTGGWLIELAKTTPASTRLVGVDMSRTFIEYARARAEAEQVSDRVEFRVMDALRILEFSPQSFDLVNHRSATSWLRTWDWPKLLQEYQRVTCTGGVVRITESTWIVESTSPALTRLSELTVKAFHQAGYLFTPTSDGVTGMLVRLLQQHGLQQVQSKTSVLECHAGTSNKQHFVEERRLGFWTVLPFLRKWTRVPDDYEAIYQQMLSEMQQPDFVARWSLLTAWGNPQSL